MIMPVKFDIASRGRLLEWLDMTVNLDLLQARNDAYLDLRCKSFCTPPCWASSCQALCAYIMGRLARFKECALTAGQLAHHVARLLVDLAA